MGLRTGLAAMLVVGSIFAGLMFSTSSANAEEVSKYAEKGFMVPNTVIDVWSTLYSYEDQQNMNTVGMWCRYEVTFFSDMYVSNGIAVEDITLAISEYEECSGNRDGSGNFHKLLETYKVDPYFKEDGSADLSTPYLQKGYKASTCVGTAFLLTGHLIKNNTIFEDSILIETTSRTCKDDKSINNL